MPLAAEAKVNPCSRFQKARGKMSLLRAARQSSRGQVARALRGACPL